MKDFKHLISHIEEIHRQLQAKAANAVNQALTIRNWLIGYFIVEFEQNGSDKAEYGEHLIDNLANHLSQIRGIDRRSLFRFRQFYLLYPGIRQTIPAFLNRSEIVGTLSPLLPGFEIVGSPSPQLNSESNWGIGPIVPDSTLQVPSEKLITRLSYSHIELFLNIEDPLKRTFYEIECIKGTWSVRELKRQINSLYFERSGLSAKPEKLAEWVHQKTSPQAPKDIIKNIYAFDFLDISTQPIIEESDLETALIDHLQSFILELGNGFCLEARQKRILIGETYYFIDLIFYHRILKCHVLVDLKIGAFEHGDIGQLNTYLNYYKQEVIEENDNVPVGVLLVAEKDHALVKYATADMDENLFIQKYLIQLPAKEQLEKYIENELKKFQ